MEQYPEVVLQYVAIMLNGAAVLLEEVTAPVDENEKSCRVQGRKEACHQINFGPAKEIMAG